MRDEEVHYLIKSLKEIAENIGFLKKDYLYNPKKNEFRTNK
jgi:hypothetical protein